VVTTDPVVVVVAPQASGGLLGCGRPRPVRRQGSSLALGPSLREGFGLDTGPSGAGLSFAGHLRPAKETAMGEEIGRHHSPVAGTGAGAAAVTDVHGHVHEAGHAGVLLDAEKLDCYRLAVAFQPLAAELVAKAGYNLRDQFERAALSIALNVAEGAARRSGRERRRFYEIARGSAAECGALIDVLLARGLVTAEAARDARHKVLRLVQMLSKMQARLG
jgi:four helix bundle protein